MLLTFWEGIGMDERHVEKLLDRTKEIRETMDRGVDLLRIMCFILGVIAFAAITHMVLKDMQDPKTATVTSK